MSPQESILFQPEIDERQLDRTVDDTNEAFSEAATDLPVSVDDRSIDGFVTAYGPTQESRFGDSLNHYQVEFVRGTRA